MAVNDWSVRSVRQPTCSSCVQQQYFASSSMAPVIVSKAESLCWVYMHSVIPLSHAFVYILDGFCVQFSLDSDNAQPKTASFASLPVFSHFLPHDATQRVILLRQGVRTSISYVDVL